MKTWKVGMAIIGLGLLAGGAETAGCKGKNKEKPKEISVGARAEAAQNFSEAEFATQIRDHARAEGLLARAVELDPAEPNYWIQLGASRKRLGNVAGARQAYEQARDLLQALSQRDRQSPRPLFAEMQVWVLLGKPDEAKRVYEKAVRDYGTDPLVKDFVQRKTFDTMLRAPALKDIAL